jgi:ATP-dependent Clp protease protease subunit
MTPKKINKRKVNEILYKGVDWDKRIIYYTTLPDTSTRELLEEDDNLSQISAITAERVKRLIDIMNSQSDLPITIEMNSGGGSVYDGMVIIDAIMNSKAPVFFIGYGSIMSMAVYIMLVCDNRILYPSTTILLHSMKQFMYGDKTVRGMKQELASYELIINQMMDIGIKNSKMDKDFWDKVEDGDFFFTAQEALALGLCDGIKEARNKTSLKNDYRKFASGKKTDEELQEIKEKALKRIKYL